MVKHHNDAQYSFFRWLKDNGLTSEGDYRNSGDGFSLLRKPLSALLEVHGIDTFPDREDNILRCEHFFDDWFLFCIAWEGTDTYGLCKLREQEHDMESGVKADGDTPGVTVSFISFDVSVLKACLTDPSQTNRKKLGVEINRVVAYAGQKHHKALKAYFIRPEAEAPYLIAQEYIARIAGYSAGGSLDVPNAYLDLLKKRNRSEKYARVPDFLDGNNEKARCMVCDHRKIYIQDPNSLSEYEELAILATHTGNVSVHSFAAEIRYHAMFLVSAARIRLPFLGSPYASAVRADMSIGDKEFQGPTPYYDLSGKLVREQEQYHKKV